MPTVPQIPAFDPNETYSVTSRGTIIRGSDGASIPSAVGNSDYAAYLAWVASGKTATVLPPPASPAPTLTFLQFMALFTSAEQDAIFASNDTRTKMFVTMAAGAGGIQLTNSEVVAGVTYLATVTTATPPGPGLIASARVAQILAGGALTS